MDCPYEIAICVQFGNKDFFACVIARRRGKGDISEGGSFLKNTSYYGGSGSIINRTDGIAQRSWTTNLLCPCVRTIRIQLGDESISMIYSCKNFISNLNSTAEISSDESRSITKNSRSSTGIPTVTTESYNSW